MKTVSKAVTGALAAALLTTAVATPAEAQYRRYDRRGGDGIGLGDVVIGTIIVGGIAAAIGALSNNNRYDRGYTSGRYGQRGYGDRQASIEACAYEVEREAGRRYGGRAQVRDLDDVDRTRDGYRVRGTLEVQSDYRYGRDGYGRDDYGYGRDRYDNDRYGRGNERVQFSCTARGNRVVALNVGSNYARGY